MTAELGSHSARSAPLSLIVAMARNRVIGHHGKLPWHLPADLERFKTLTMGHHIIMGRRTWESIGRALPGRVSVVVTRNPAYRAPGATVVDSLAAAFELAADDEEPFVIGGGALYLAALPSAHRIYLTEVLAEYPGDVFFPPLSTDHWSSSSKELHAAEGDKPAWSFAVYERRL